MIETVLLGSPEEQGPCEWQSGTWEGDRSRGVGVRMLHHRPKNTKGRTRSKSARASDRPAQGNTTKPPSKRQSSRKTDTLQANQPPTGQGTLPADHHNTKHMQAKHITPRSLRRASNCPNPLKPPPNTEHPTSHAEPQSLRAKRASPPATPTFPPTPSTRPLTPSRSH